MTEPAPLWPVDLTVVAVVRDPDTGEALATIEVDHSTPAHMQVIGLELDKRGYSPLFYNAETRRFCVTARGARRT
jgi:hypothetical protein